MSERGHLSVEDSSCRGPATVPFHVVGRVLRGTGQGYSSKSLEVAFDFGTPEMRSQRWGIREREMPAIRQFNDPEEYQRLLIQCEAEFVEAEAKIDSLVKARERSQEPKAKKTKKKLAPKPTTSPKKTRRR